MLKIFNNIPIKYLYHVAFQIIVTISSLNAMDRFLCQQYAQVSVTNHQTLFEVPDTREQREAKLDHAIKEISELEDIYRFDPALLIQDGSTSPPLNFSGVDLQRAISLLPFYSEDPSERNYAFRRSIQEPILNILCDAAESTYKFPQTVKYLQSLKVTGSSQAFLDIAFRDLFADPTEGLSTVSNALRGLKANKRLSADEENKLRLFRNLAGYFYDRKALTYLQVATETVLDAKPDISLCSGRVALLRAIQLPGEFFKLMLPSTLSLDPTLPSEGVLEGLRDRLSHLSRMKFDKLFGPSPEATLTFQNLLVDIARLKSCLETMIAGYDAATKDLSPTQLWAHIKSLPNARTEIPTSWNGMESLIDLLAPPSPTVVLPSLSYAMEFNDLVPLPPDTDENERYLQRREGIRSVLNRKGDALNNVAEIHDALLKLGVTIDISDTTKLCSQLKEEWERLSQLYQSGKKSVGDQKKEELRKLINQRVLGYLGVSPEQNETYEQRREIIRKAVEQQQNLRRLLDQMKPCNGFGNLSDKYAEFCDKLKEAGIALPQTIFEWDKDPTTVLEMLFHKVHRTGLSSKQDKNNLRRARIQSLLEIIELIKTQLGVNTSLESETTKEIHKIIIEGKVKIMADVLRTQPPQEKKDLQDLQDIQERLYQLGSDALVAATPDDLNKVLILVDQAVVSFIAQYEGMFPQPSSTQTQVITDLKEALLNKNRGHKIHQLRDFISRQQVQANHRFHKPTRVENSLNQHLKTSTTGIVVYEFLVSTFYELLKEVNDYPELGGLRDTDQIRNHFSHVDPFELEPLRVKSSKTFDSGTYINDNEGTLAKELAILVINVRYLLEDLRIKLQ
jgi:hypothetical protein